MITISSDFGSPYPAAMKGVIATRVEARLIDIANDFPRHDIRTTAFWLREILPYFPPAVHLVVVDPGVGTDRDALAIRAGEHALVGPDNGVLWSAATRLADDDPEAFVIDRTLPASAPATFHGRDIFAPAAADIHAHGIAEMAGMADLRPTSDIEKLTFPTADIEDSTAKGTILAVDGFGNAITNIPGPFLRPHFGDAVTVDGSRYPAAASYAAVAPGEAVVTVGSHGNVELAVNRGDGAAVFGVWAGDPVTVTVPAQPQD